MGDPIVFTTRLTSDDWDAGLRAWHCPVLDLESAFVKQALDETGQEISPNLVEIQKGPARLSWKGQTHPAQISVVVGLGENLSPTSKEDWWKGFSVVVPIISAVIAALATFFSVPRPGPAPGSHALQLVVLPNDNDASGLPPAKITVNGEELKQPIKYKVASDIMAVVDVNRAFKLAKTLDDTTTALVPKLKDVSKQVSDFTASLSQILPWRCGRLGRT